MQITSVEDLLRRELIGKQIHVETVNNEVHTGYIYVVDPASKTVVLTDEENNTTFITSHSIKSLTLNPDKYIKLDPIESIPALHQDLHKKKETLKDWLKANMVDMDEDGPILKYKNQLIIEPPYDLEHCYCSNTIILGRFTALYSKMPSFQL